MNTEGQCQSMLGQGQLTVKVTATVDEKVNKCLGQWTTKYTWKLSILQPSMTDSDTVYQVDALGDAYQFDMHIKV